MIASLSSCGIYTKYHPQTEVSDKLYGDSVLNKPVTEYEDSTSLGFMPWREMFSDPQPQESIERGLAQNTDYPQSAERVKEAQATLKAARLAYLPSFAISPQGSVSSFDNSKAAQTYSIPLNMSWEIDIFGRLRNAKQQSKALYAKSKDYQQAVRTQLIANISNIYYTLITLDQQLSLSVKTEEAWRETPQTARALMKAGRYNEAGVSQMEATMHSVHASVLDLKSQIAQTENSMAILLSETPRHYARSSAEDMKTTENFKIGVPLQLLSSRPDVRQAQRSMEYSFYGVNLARSAFYPSLTLSGSIGWTNSSGVAIVNPGKFIASALGSIVATVVHQRAERGAAEDSEGADGRGAAWLHADIAQCGQGGERRLDDISDGSRQGGDSGFADSIAGECPSQHYAADGARQQYLSRGAHGTTDSALGTDRSVE